MQPLGPRLRGDDGGRGKNLRHSRACGNPGAVRVELPLLLCPPGCLPLDPRLCGGPPMRDDGGGVRIHANRKCSTIPCNSWLRLANSILDAAVPSMAMDD